MRRQHFRSPLIFYFVFTDVGPLPIQFMHRAHVEAQLDKLLQHEEYTEILLLDETPPPDKEGDKGEEEEEVQEKEQESEPAPSQRGPLQEN